MSFQIISKELSDPVRSHKDLDKDAAPYYKKAVKFYDSIAKQLVAQGHVLDLFASALDQVLKCRDFNLLDAQNLVLFFIYECVGFLQGLISQLCLCWCFVCFYLIEYHLSLTP